MGQKLTNAPVYFSIVQVKFNPLFKLDTYAPDIQDRLRRAGFPDAKKEVLTHLSVVPTNAAEQAPAAMPITQSSRYKFGTKDATAEFILDQFALTYQTTEYDVFDSFTKKFLDGLDAVQQIAALDYVDRIGVRYLNAIKAREGERLEQYLVPQLLGLSTTLGGNLVHSYSETRVKREGVELLVRSIQQDSSLGFPPDLQPMTLHVPQRFAELDRLHAILDIDGWMDARENFDRDFISKALYRIHDYVEEAFKSSATPHAKKVWA
jgi:uncharacterized protein (TIGR04255 family)